MFQRYTIENVIEVLKYSIQNYFIFISTAQIRVDPDTERYLRSAIRLDLPAYSEGGSMIPVDLPETAKGGSTIQTDPGFI